MIVWRGAGIFVLVLAAIGLGAGLMPAHWASTQFFPDNSYRFQLFMATQPWIFAGCLALAAAVGGGLMWLAGTRLNRDEDVHTLFFVPFQWWGPLFATLVLIFAGDVVIRDGVTRAHGSFVSSCSEHERGASPEECECMAAKLETHRDPVMIIPFYAAMEDTWRDRYSENEDAIDAFFTNYVSTQPQAKGQDFAVSLDESFACFGDIGPPRPAEEPSEPTEPAPQPSPEAVPPPQVQPQPKAPGAASPPKAPGSATPT